MVGRAADPGADSHARERRSSRAQDGAPGIPEPMVFDLVRPLGGKKGELEANVLGLIPLRRRAGAIDQVPDPLGLVPQSRRSAAIELSPEIEYAVRDGVALELRCPWRIPASRR